LLDSQFADLEEPAEDETYISVDVRGTPDQIAEEVIRELHLTSKGRTT
jgi:gluconate kinase